VRSICFVVTPKRARKFRNPAGGETVLIRSDISKLSGLTDVREYARSDELTGRGFRDKSSSRTRVDGGLAEGANCLFQECPRKYGECGLTSGEARSTPPSLSVFMWSVSRPRERALYCAGVCQEA